MESFSPLYPCMIRKGAGGKLLLMQPPVTKDTVPTMYTVEKPGFIHKL